MMGYNRNVFPSGSEYVTRMRLPSTWACPTAFPSGFSISRKARRGEGAPSRAAVRPMNELRARSESDAAGGSWTLLWFGSALGSLSPCRAPGGDARPSFMSRSIVSSSASASEPRRGQSFLRICPRPDSSGADHFLEFVPARPHLPFRERETTQRAPSSMGVTTRQRRRGRCQNAAGTIRSLCVSKNEAFLVVCIAAW